MIISRYYFLLLTLMFALGGCSPKKASDPKAPPTEIGDTVLTDPKITATNSLKYLGTYQGDLPCKVCQGERVILDLAEDFSYHLKRFDPKNPKFNKEAVGNYSWGRDGTSILLTPSGEPFSEFLVKEGKLLALDDMRKPIPGLELIKLSESAAIIDKSEDNAPKITGTHWRLSEINSKPLKDKEKSDFFIEFKKGKSFGAFAGCNRMGGKYNLNGSKLHLFDVVSTMMSCPEMGIEDQFKRSLTATDNFVANSELLQFRKGGVNLMKFEAVHN